MKNLYYLDNAATTKTFDEIFDILKSNNDDFFYNPSASYRPAISAKKQLDTARDELTKLLHGNNGKLYFTSSATESNNTIFSGLHLRTGQTVLISAGEHPSVHTSAHLLSKKGIKVVEIPLDNTGAVDFEEYKKLLEDNTVALVSVIHSSNENGKINDIKKLCSYAKSVNKDIIFHSDGVQAFGKIKIDLRDLGVDLYTISAHKIYAPRGVGGLWVKNNMIIDALLVGGGQENGFRSSTENVAGAVAFAYAAKKLYAEFDENYNKVLGFKRTFISKLLSCSAGQFVKVNSLDDETFNPYVVSVSVKDIKGEVLMSALEYDGVLVSTGSACSSKKAGNRVLEAMGLDFSDVVGSIRISFSPYIDYNFDEIISIFEKNILRFEANNNVKKRK